MKLIWITTTITPLNVHLAWSIVPFAVLVAIARDVNLDTIGLEQLQRNKEVVTDVHPIVINAEDSKTWTAPTAQLTTS
jgi:hypothetical protein